MHEPESIKELDYVSRGQYDIAHFALIRDGLLGPGPSGTVASDQEVGAYIGGVV